MPGKHETREGGRRGVEYMREYIGLYSIGIRIGGDESIRIDTNEGEKKYKTIGREFGAGRWNKKKRPGNQI